MTTEIRLLRVNAAADITGTSVSEYYSRAARGLVPPLLKIGVKASRVPSYELDIVNKARIAGRSDAQIREIVRGLVKAREHLLDDAVQ